MKFFLFSLVFLAAAQIEVYAQSNMPSEGIVDYKSAISLVPQYAIISGIRVDYERKLKHEDKWILFAPQIYLRADTDGGGNYYDYDDMTGWGLNVYYKQFLAHSRKKNANGLSKTNVYFSAGPTFQHTNINRRNQTTVINKYGGNVNFGFQLAFGSFLLDLYAGIGIRYALDSDGKLMDDFNDRWIDYGYSGIILDGGVRLGFFIP